jgi:hypothetical protein
MARKTVHDIRKTVEFWLGPEVNTPLERFIQGLIAVTRYFGARGFAKKYHDVSAQPSAILERCRGLEELT